MKPKVKKLLIGGIALAVAAATGVGIWFAARGSGEPVKVFPFHYVGMTEYWGDNQESYGPVSTDRIQTVYITETQIITEIAVKQGDTVKKGDLLMSFDTTLSDLAVERKRLGVEKLKLQLEEAEGRLWDIRNMKPMVIPPATPEDDEESADLGEKLQGDFQLSHDTDYDGGSKDTALICWLNTGASINDTVLEEIRKKAETYQNLNAEAEWNAYDPSQDQDTSTGETGETTETTEPTQRPPFEPFAVNKYYAIIKVTQGNAELGNRLSWQGVYVEGNEHSGFSFQFFDAHGVMDHMLSEENEDAADTSIPEIDYGSGYTAAQIAQMRAEQEQKIKDLEFQIKMAEADYKIMLTEVSDGNVYAQIDGEVVSLLTEEDARMLRQPILKVSGGGGFFVEGSISELEKEKLQIGQEVTINDWNTGMTYTGEVTAIGDFPSTDNGWNGMGNPNASFYPFTAFVDETADLQAGSYASIMFSTAGSEHGVYLQNPFVRSEQGNFYVYLRGGDGKLEKRPVSVGKSLWGSYMEILSGVGEEDLIAFPYGKDLREGADTVESDLSALYE